MRDCDHEELNYLGALGDTGWGRCRFCGLDVVVEYNTGDWYDANDLDPNGWDESE